MAKDSVLPAAARVLPPAGQALWIKAFKEAQLKGLPEDEASAFAWAAVKRAGYSKQGNGKWGKLMDAQLVVENDTFTLGVPFVKINAQKRTVSGFATLDNVDKAGEILDAGASKDAFAKWAGNIREMHDRKAVGKAVEMIEKEYTGEDGRTYQGIWITAKISKGAEDTWQKCIDGTLSGFSVGGATQEKERQMVKLGDEEVEVWRITKYSLNEVSLVDNPCNGLALVTLVKSVDGALELTDVVEDEDLEKVAHAPGSTDCCEGELETVLNALGSWRNREIEKGADHEVAAISHLMANVRSYRKMEEYEHEDHQRMVSQVSKTNESEGETLEKTDDNLQDKEISDNSVTDDELTEEHRGVLRKLAELVLGIKPAADETVEVEKEELAKEGDTSEMDEAKVKELLDEKEAELTKSVDGKFSEIGDSLTKISELLESVAKTEAIDELKKELEEKVDALAGRVETLETTGAVKKSGDKVSSDETLEKDDKGLWADTIVPEFLRKQVG
jgi:cation transport regulator ChaB